MINPPGIILIQPKYRYNIGMIKRLASAYEIPNLIYTGSTQKEISKKNKIRLPREERIPEYNDVQIINHNRPLNIFTGGTPIAFELVNNAQDLTTFDWPINPIMIFGPENGSIPKGILSMCHHYVMIPTKHCLNVATAVATVLYDRKLKCP